jgi:hypothetical protein
MMNYLILCHLEWSNAKTDHKNEIRTKKLSRKHLVKVKVNGQQSTVSRADVAAGVLARVVHAQLLL